MWLKFELYFLKILTTIIDRQKLWNCYTTTIVASKHVSGKTLFFSILPCPVSYRQGNICLERTCNRLYTAEQRQQFSSQFIVLSSHNIRQQWMKSSSVAKTYSQRKDVKRKTRAFASPPNIFYFVCCLCLQICTADKLREFGICKN